MKVTHSFYFDSKGSLGIMNGKLDIQAEDIPFVSSIVVNMKIINSMYNEGLLNIDIERLKKVVEIHKYNKKMIQINQDIKKLLKKYFSYEYLNQGTIGLDIFEGSSEEMLIDLKNIKEKFESEEKISYEGAFNHSHTEKDKSSIFVCKGTMLVLTAIQTKGMFDAIEEHFKKYFDNSEKEVFEDKLIYKKYEKLMSEKGFEKIKNLLNEMSNSTEEKFLIKYGEELNNYIEEIESTQIYV